jgi:ankyrin repeat protein
MIMPVPQPPFADKNRELFAAAIRGDAARVKEMLAAGASPDAKGARFQGATPMAVLCAAAEAGHLECVELLVAAGAKLEEGTPEGRRPLICAVRDGHAEIAAFLLGRGASPKATYGSETLLDIAERCPQPLPMIRVLLGHMDEKAKYAAIFRAAREGRRDIVMVAAMMKDFDANRRDDLGNTALILAAQSRAPEDKTAAIVGALLRRGAEVDAVNDFNETALCAAMTRQPVAAEVVALLVNAGADITRQNLSGLTNYEAAQLAGNERILPFFETVRRQQVLREMKKYLEGTGSRITVRSRPHKPGKPSP